MIEESFQPSQDGKCAVAEGGMVATASPAATAAGVSMLERDGNAVDAACAAAFALAVSEPQASGLGGESKAILHFNGETVVIDGSSRVPEGFALSCGQMDDLRFGYRGTSVPSTVAVLAHLHRRFGAKPWRDIIEPAMGIAREGYCISALQENLLQRELDRFIQIPSQSGARYFLKNGRHPYREGDLFRQHDLASLLEDLADFGPEYFYRGNPAKLIDSDMKGNGGFLRAEDLDRIPWPRERKPITAAYRGMEVSTAPPSSGGRMLLFTLMVLGRLPATMLAQGAEERCGLLAEVFQEALISSKKETPDPFIYSFENDIMCSRSTIEKVAIALTGGRQSSGLPRKDSGGETTHLSVMDCRGNAVGITQSINLVYGAKAAAQGLGFIYNDYLIDMERNDRENPHFLRPGAPSVSSVAPTIVTCNGTPWMVVGSPGSERIFSTVTQFISNMLDRGMPMCRAMKEPRLHCFIDGRISYEGNRFPPSVLDHLAECGYELDEREPWSFFLGAIHAVLKCATRPGYQGVAEIRRDGTARGPRSL
ncbi:MAG: gamma-glutamyltransferase [Deltaproteobacteria bacterium]|nr:gamma-glutamyltransferase [Deltaproteobacteria bacterium]